MTQVETQRLEGKENRIRNLHTAMEKLAQIRDEQRVKLHLAKADARDEWASVEARWNQLRGRFQKAQEVAEDAGDEVWKDMEALLDDVKQGYDRVRRAL